MTERADTILLQGMRLEGCHGATDEERAREDVRSFLSLLRARGLVVEA